MRRDLAERNFAFVESELNNERAAALGRAVRRVQQHFERCQQLVQLVDDCGGDEFLHDYREARKAFEHSRWQLCVHREALRLNHHTWIERTFPTPPRR